MSDLLKSLGLAAMIALAGPATAQDSTGTAADSAADTGAAAAAPAADAAAPAADAGAQLETYVDEVFTDWQRECIRMPDGQPGTDPCRMAQIIVDAAQKPVGKIALGRMPEGTGAVATAEVALPLELGILLPQGLTVGVDQGLSKQYEFYTCTQGGCVARLLLGADDVQAFKAGETMNLGLVAFLPPEFQATRLQIPVSLKGFTAAFDSLPVPPAPAQQ